MEFWKMANGNEISVNEIQISNIMKIYDFLCAQTDKTKRRWYSFNDIHKGTRIGRHQVASACTLLTFKDKPYLKLRVYKYFKPVEGKRNAVRISHQVCLIRRIKSDDNSDA